MTDLRLVRRRLLHWFDKNKRMLPWRSRQADAYAQWVAEIMLQQTRVETVERYYERFLARFPNVSSLAQGTRQEVLKLWEGLGYYRRAHHLHQAAGELEKSGNGLPQSAAEWGRLPGIGVYTSAAIASIAYGEPVAAVDGNVARVVGRLLGLRDANTAAARSCIQEAADSLLSRKRPGDFNQAWMDLGSRVCLPRDPRCPVCPLRTFCATANGSKPAVSMAPPRPAPKKLGLAVGMLIRNGRVLMEQRAKGGLWSGLWEFPSQECGPAPAAAMAEIVSVRSLAWTVPARKIGVLEHRLTHRALTFHIFEAAVEADGPKSKGRKWVSGKALQLLPVSTAHRRIHRLWLTSRPRALS